MNNRNGFDHIVSLGYNCEVSFRIMDYLGRDIDSYPLSWAYILDQGKMIHALDQLGRLAEKPKLTFLPESGMFLVDGLGITVHTRISKPVQTSDTQSKEYTDFLEAAATEICERNTHLCQKWEKLLNGEESVLFLVKLQEFRGKENCAAFLLALDDWLGEHVKSGRYLLACFTDQPDSFAYYRSDASIAARQRVRLSLVKSFAPDSDTKDGGDHASWMDVIRRWDHSMDLDISTGTTDGQAERAPAEQKEGDSTFDFTKEPGQRLLDRSLSRDGAPLVSIITPYYNAGRYFQQTFHCVMNQTFPWFEWIIVDDGSTDSASIELFEHFGKMDPRIRLFRKENGGISTARNRGIQEATTDLILPLDADDLIEPTYVETQFWALRFNPDYDWSYSNNIGFHNQQYTWDKPFDAKLLKTYNFLCYCGLIRAQALEEVGCYDEITKHYYEDWRLWLKLLSAHKKPVKTQNYGFWYRRLDSGVLSIVNNDPKTQKLASQLIQEAAETADTTITAKTYPTTPQKDYYHPPKASDWTRKTFQSHDKIHVLMLLPWLEMGGADRYNLDLCARLDKNRFELGIITTQQSDNAWQQRFAEHVTDIFHLPEFLDTEYWAEFISYYIKSREVDVLFLSNSYFGYYLLPLLRREFPQLAITDYVHMEEWYWRNGGYARTSGVMGAILEKTQVCNEGTRQVLLHDFGRRPESVETVYIGVDKDVYDPSKVEGGLVKATLGIRESRPIILFPCRIHQQKRPFLMLEIAKRLPKYAFVVVGDGPELDALRSAVRKARLESTVFFAGRQSDMLPWYRDASLTLLCSIKEGLALTAYESLSMGVPVVSSDVGGQSELIDSTVGRIVPLMQNEAEDIENLSYSRDEISLYVDAIQELLSDQADYDRMCAACRDRILQRFSSQRMIIREEEILTELAHDPDALRTRTETAQALEKLGAYVDDAFGTYLRLESKFMEAESTWQSREYYRRQYEQAAQDKGGFLPVPYEASSAQETLDWIYHMRSWRLVQAYIHFMDETWIGRILRRIRDCFKRKK